MASTEAPDPRSLPNWEDAFQYPVLTVRGMEKKLRGSLTENQDKLRTLVGASYRDLLNTARTIIEINGQLQEVEGLLGQTSRKTDSRSLDTLGRNVARFEKHKAQLDRARNSAASQSSSLRACLNLVAKLLKTHASSLLAAKLLVLARLLHKSLSKDAGEIDHLDAFASRIGSLRERLLRHIDRRLATPDPTTDQLVEDLTAFSFVTSSSPSDTLAQFLRVRAAAVERPRRSDDPSISKSVIGRLDLYLSTLSLSRQVFPELMTASLKRLASLPLLSDPSIAAMDGLKLDVHARWFTDEVRNYTPWARHDELQRAHATQLLRAWAVRVLNALPRSIEQDLSEETDVSALATVRKDVLQSWLSSRRTARNFIGRDALKRLQEPFVLRFRSITETTSAEMRVSMSNAIISSLETWDAEQDSKALPSLWDSSMQALDISDGASTFRTTVVDRRRGRTMDLVALTEDFERCERKIAALQAAIKSMRDARWDDDYDDDSASADDEEDDHDESNSISNQLSRKDPDQLQAFLRSNITDAIDALQSTLQSAPLLSNLNASHPRAAGIFVLRSLRTLRARILPLLSILDSKAMSIQPLFCQSLVSSIQNTLSTTVDSEAAPVLTSALDRLVKEPLRIRALWDGKPPVPVQPLPGSFRYLRAVVRSMECVGADLWTADVVKALKTAIAERVSKCVADCIKRLEDVEPAKTSGHPSLDNKGEESPSDDEKDSAKEDKVEPGSAIPNVGEITTEDDQRDKVLQLLFDAVYLQQALESVARGARKTAADIDPLDGATQALTRKSGADEAVVGRVGKNARDYWRRTYLLFGLLMP